jgi:hypothetical protein
MQEQALIEWESVDWLLIKDFELHKSPLDGNPDARMYLRLNN